MRRFITFLVLGILLLMVIVVVFTRTSYFKTILREQIIAAANKHLNGRFDIGKITGNLITHFEISKVLLTQNADTVFYLPKLKVALSPKRLLKKELLIHVISVDSLLMQLQQMPDSSWNISHLLQKKETIPAKEQQPVQWKISLHDFKLKQAKVKILPLSKAVGLPSVIDGIKSRLSLSYNNASFALILKDFHLQTHQPDFTIESISMQLMMEGNKLHIRQLLIHTLKSQIEGESTITYSRQPEVTVRLSAFPFHFSDIENFLPDFPLKNAADVILYADYVADSLNFDLRLGQDQQQLQTQGVVKAISREPAYTINTHFKAIELNKWLADPRLKIRLNGDLQIDGIGTKLSNAALHSTAILRHCQAFDRTIHKLAWQGDYRHGEITTQLAVTSSFGEVFLTAKINDIIDSQQFKIHGNAQRLNLATLFLTDSLQSNIYLNFMAEGKGLVPDSIDANLNVQAAHSAFYDTFFDTLFARVHIKKNDYLIDTLHVQTQLGRLDLSGKISKNAYGSMRFLIASNDLGKLNSLIAAEQLEAKGFVKGVAQGKLDSMLVTCRFQLHECRFNSISADSIYGDFQFAHPFDKIEGSAKANVRNLKMSTMTVDTLIVESTISDSVISAALHFARQDSIAGNVVAKFIHSDESVIELPHVSFNIKQYHWTGGSEEMRIVLGQGNYELRQIAFVSDDQFIKIDGKLALPGVENLRIEAGNIDAQMLPILAGAGIRLAGKMGMEMNVQGTSEKPVIGGRLAVDHGLFNNYTFDYFAGQFHYADENLTWNIALIPGLQHTITADGFLPINLSLPKKSDLLDTKRPIKINIKTEGIDLSLLKAMTSEFIDVSGTIVCDVTIDNTIDNFRPRGQVELVNGRLRIPAYGIDYDNLQLSLGLDTTSVNLKRCTIRGDKGVMTIAGNLQINRTDVKNIIKQINLNVTTANFLLVNNKDMELNIEGELLIFGEAAVPQFDGLIRLLRSRFYIPALMQSAHQDMQQAQPLLVQASGGSTISSEKPLTIIKPTPNLIDKLRGSIKIEIPRNTWLRSADLNIEISGDLVIVKQEQTFQLFGAVDILRGNYNLYGRRFKIQKGNFIFQGGTEYNPEIELKAQHIFRTITREKKVLTLQVTGKALSPKLNFALDNVAISEGDAVSYLVLGQSLEELTHSQRSDLDKQTSFTAGDAANDLLTGIVARQITSTLGKKLNLDVIEFKGEQNWQNATFVVGKYLTNNLFLSYQREFGNREQNQVIPDEITLEYEINKHLFFQLIQGSEKTTGFDFIIKFEK